MSQQMVLSINVQIEILHEGQQWCGSLVQYAPPFAVMSSPCHLPFAILDNHSEIHCPNRDVPNYTMTSSTHNGAMCNVKGIGTTGVNPGFKLVLNPN